MFDTIKFFTNKLHTQTATVKSLKITNSELNRILLDNDKELKTLTSEFNKINHITKYKSIVQFDTLKVIFKDSIPCTFNRTGTVKTNWYSFDYSLNPESIKIDSFAIPTQTTIITGSKRKWFLGNETLTTDITTTNPYIRITKIKSAEIIINQPWYKKWYVWLGAGIITGWISTK